MTGAFQIINEYSVFIQKNQDNLLKNMNVVVCQSKKIYQDSLFNTECLSSEFISNWKNYCKVENYTPQVDEISKWEKWYKEFIDDDAQHKVDGHNFNVFYLLRYECGFNVKETMHSKLIKYLLDPFASHGQGNKFLINFLNLLKIENPNKGMWNITAEQGKIDILLHRSNPETIIVVENKSNWANDQPNQLYRYWYYAIFSRIKEIEKDFYSKNKDKYQIIYLAPNSNKEISEQSISKPEDWSSNLPDKIPMEIETQYFNDFIQEWLEDCKKQLSETNHRIREYITQYQVLCNNL